MPDTPAMIEPRRDVWAGRRSGTPGKPEEKASGEMTEKASRKAANTPTVTFLFVGMGRPTALHESYPDQMYAALERHDENER